MFLRRECVLIWGRLILGLSILLLAGCAVERSAEWGTRVDYHSIVSSNWSLDCRAPRPTQPLYVVGIEKLSRRLAPEFLVHRIDGHPKRSCIADDPDNCLRLGDVPSDLADSIVKILDDRKVQWPTHIAQIRGDGSSCQLFSIYSEAINSCGPGQDAASLAPDKAWQGLEALSNAIRRDIDDADRRGMPITHLVLLATGWNTFQDESAKNFADWANSLTTQAPAGFTPLFVGVSWQSTWGDMDGLAGGLLSVLSFGNKSNDADEVGFTWGNQLLNRYLLEIAAEHELEVLVIGHSFGTRIAAAALHGRTLLTGLQPTSRRPVNFVALQPAFSVNRLRPGENEAFYTSALPPIDGSCSFYTASEYDKATAKGNLITGWFGKKPYVSSPQVVRVLSRAEVPAYLSGFERWRVECTEGAKECSKQGPIRIERASAESGFAKTPLVDASAIIRDAPSGSGAISGSGAHSDVYDAAAAQLVFSLTGLCSRSE